MGKLLVAVTLLLAAATAASAESVTGRMIFNSKDARVMGLKTATGLVALGHAPEMQVAGISSAGDLKVCDELEVEVIAAGPIREIRKVTFKKSGNAADCPFPSAAAIPATDMYRALVDKSAAVYDVRTPEEYAAAHFHGAINLPLPEVAGRHREFPTDRPIIIYCASARRSAYAAAILKEKGIPAVIVKGTFVVRDGAPRIEE